MTSAQISGAVGEVDLGVLVEMQKEREDVDEDNSITEQAAGNLMASFTKDDDELTRARQAKRSAAQERLDKRREKLAEKHKKQLLASGAPPETVAMIVEEEEQMCKEEAKGREEVEREFDAEAAAVSAVEATASYPVLLCGDALTF